MRQSRALALTGRPLPLPALLGVFPGNYFQKSAQPPSNMLHPDLTLGSKPV